MKRLKDFLILFIPLAAFTVLPVIVFVTSSSDNAIIDNSQYLKMLLKDEFLCGVVVNTYIRTLIFTSVFGIAVAILLKSLILRIKRGFLMTEVEKIAYNIEAQKFIIDNLHAIVRIV